MRTCGQRQDFFVGWVMQAGYMVKRCSGGYRKKVMEMRLLWNDEPAYRPTCWDGSLIYFRPMSACYIADFSGFMIYES